MQRGCVGRHLANRNELRVSGSESYELLFLLNEAALEWLVFGVTRRRRFERDIMKRSWMISCDEIMIPSGLAASSHAMLAASSQASRVGVMLVINVYKRFFLFFGLNQEEKV